MRSLYPLYDNLVNVAVHTVSSHIGFVFRVIVIDTSHPLETMKRVYRALAKKIWSMIPKEAKGGNIMCYY